uniref:Reverse transcriptase domain-containing protein n=1 Tax=Pygocentrus nattereri TaxID=42514 RepID=A0AAR2IMM0_PYGNA
MMTEITDTQIHPITIKWAIYLEQNNLPEISPCVLWEAGKAVMRGKIISYCTHKKNKEKTLILELEQKIKSLENAYADQITTLDSPFSSSEFYKAIQHLPNNKAPGPDGFPAEFYKEFWPVLEPTFFRMVTQIKNNHTISPNMNSANISLLLKPGKDPTLPSSYRPISLINVDLKIICKVLARRLEKITPSIIHSDQTGFIKGRHSADNTRRLINIIDYCSINKLEKIVVSLDAEKAFDRVNWKFLLAVLHKFGFGPSFINWIETLYSSPNARVRTNDLISQSFSLQRGTRQGSIHNSEGKVVIDQKRINDPFKVFYKDLYTSERNTTELIEGFFSNLQAPTLGESEKSRLEGTITMEEIDTSVKKMRSGNAPGLDGFPIEFYRTFSTQITPLLCRVFEEILEKEALPSTMTEAVISILLKKNKDPLKCELYGPVSLLCCDYKILSKVLATRLESVMSKKIHPDLTGLIAGRQLSNNLRRLYNVLYLPNNETSPEVILSLDAHKAFDRIKYNYLFTALRTFGFGPTFISWVKILGTRQGCSLSPLLFNLAIKPLALALRNSISMSGINREGQIHKLSLYAEDLLLFLSDSNTSIPAALNIISDFGRTSGYKINLTKSLLFSINEKAHQMSFQHFPFLVTKDKFTYLGVTVTSAYKDLFDNNYKPALDKSSGELRKMQPTPSLAPRILFLFQTIPIFIPKAFFKELNKITSTFIWNRSLPQIRREFLEGQKEEGGLALPNYMYYYWAANIHKLGFWALDPLDEELPAWALMKRRSCNPVSLLSLICAPLPLGKRFSTNNPVVSGSLKIWTQLRIHFNMRQALSSAPITANALFPPSLIDSTFHVWARKGVSHVKDLFRSNSLISFEQLKSDFDIPQSNFFRYLQVRSFVKKYFSPSLTTLERNWIDDRLSINPLDRGVVSILYENIQRVTSPTLNHIKAQWEEELGEEISEEAWQRAVQWVPSSSVCVKHGLLQFKVLHRLHFSRSKLAKLYPNTDPTCLRCKKDPGTLSHMFWTCPQLLDFWMGIFNTFSHIWNINFKPNPLTGLFGVVPVDILVTSDQSEVEAFSTLLARRMILCRWKKYYRKKREERNIRVQAPMSVASGDGGKEKLPKIGRNLERNQDSKAEPILLRSTHSF